MWTSVVYMWLSCVLSIDSRQCSVHLINKGVTIEDNSATIEFEGTGSSEDLVVSEFVCQLDDGGFNECKNYKSSHKSRNYWYRSSVSTTKLAFDTNATWTYPTSYHSNLTIIPNLQLLKVCIKCSWKERMELKCWEPNLRGPVPETDVFFKTP